MIDAPTHTLPDNVARYYDENTLRFLRYGGSGDTGAIHRQIWAPGVENIEQAFLYLNQFIARAIAPAISQANPMPLPRGRVLDLGCGVGGTTTWLVQRLGVQSTGVTNSAVQYKLAIERARCLGLEKLCQFVLADFTDLPLANSFDSAYAIESFIHAQDAKRFFSHVASQVRAGGRLVVCDDFLSARALPPHATPVSQAWVDRFHKGWHLRSLLPLTTVKDLADEAGFRLIQEHNLTPYLRPFNPWVLRGMKLITRLPLRSAYWDNLSGGTALQVCILNGWTQYVALVWERIL